MTSPLIEFREITKRFGSTLANDRVSFSIARGSFHGIVGENGAGKSTIMKTLFGLYRPDSGEIWFEGRVTEFDSPAQALERKIGMVHQHFQLIPRLEVWRNIILGAEPSTFFINEKQILEDLATFQAAYHCDLPLEAKVESLSLGQQQQIEILKCLYRQADILVLDEPTAVLTPPEVDRLFIQLKAMQRAGKTIIVVTHKLREILTYTDNVTVMRQGRALTTVPTPSLTAQSLAEWIMGRLPPALEKSSARPATSDVALEFQGITTHSTLPRLQIEEVSFQISPGEIVGLAGVEGNGQDAIAEILAGLLPYSGTVRVLGQDFGQQSAYAWKQNGLGLIPPDRHAEGLILDFSLAENFLLGRHRERTTGAPQLSAGRIQAYAEPFLKENGVTPPRPDLPARALSGGNQQKLIFARETTSGVRVLLACHPTRGVDIGSSYLLHQKLLELREQGVAILLISSEIDELLALSDRLMVFYRGRVVAALPTTAVSETKLGLWMTGESVA